MARKFGGGSPVPTLRRAVRARLARTVYQVGKKLYEPHRSQVEQDIAKLRTELRADIEREVSRGIDRITEFEIRLRKDTMFAGDQAAALESSRFANENLVGCPHFAHPSETLDYALSLAPHGGLALEFGVATGKTLERIASRRGDSGVFGFDSFTGLPEGWMPGMPAGAFARDDLPEVPGAELVVGLFEDTLPSFLDTHDDTVDFVHVDSDIYSAAATVLTQLESRLRPGTVIVFDEFFNYPGWQRHEYKAWQEFLARTGVDFRYEAYTYQNHQVVVRLV